MAALLSFALEFWLSCGIRLFSMSKPLLMLYLRFCSACMWPTRLCSLYPCPLSDSPLMYPRLGDKGLPMLIGLCKGLRLNAWGLCALELLSFGELGLLRDWCVWLFAFKRICWVAAGWIACEKGVVRMSYWLTLIDISAAIYLWLRLCLLYVGSLHRLDRHRCRDMLCCRHLRYFYDEKYLLLLIFLF